MSDVPYGWGQRRLMDLVRIPNGQVDPRVEPFRSQILLAPDHIAPKSGRIICCETAASQGAISRKYQVFPGDVLYSKIRPALRKAALADFSGICSADIYPLRPSAEIDSSYLLNVVLSDRFSQFADSVSGRSGIPKINRTELEEFHLVLPPIAEQRRIAEILDVADEAVRSTERLAAKLEQTRKGLLHELLTRGVNELGCLREPGSNAVSFQESVPGRITSTWPVMSIGDACSIVQDGTHLPPPRVPDGPLLLSVRNIIGQELVLTGADTRIPRSFFNAMHRNWRIELGDVCIAVVGATIGKLARVGKLPTFTIQRSLAVLRGNPELLDNEYLLEVLSTPELQHQIWDRVNQTAQPGIYLAELRGLPLPVPPLGEQRRICTRLTAIRAQADSALREVAKLVSLKRGLMDDLLTGRVRVGASE